MSSNKPSENSAILTDFTPEYKESVFIAWYNGGRISLKRLLKVLPVPEDGRKPPSLGTIQNWYDSEGWAIRADAMDAEVAREIERTAIEEKIAMIRRHAKIAQKLIEKGDKYLDSAGFDKSADAVRAIVQGVEIERASRGIMLALDEIGRLSDEKLVDYIQKKLQEANVGASADGEIVEGEVKDA